MAGVVNERIVGIPRLYLYTGSIILYGIVILLTNLPALQAGTSGLAQEIATVAAVGMVAAGIYEAYTKDPGELDVPDLAVGLLVLGATGFLVSTLIEFFGVW